MLYGYEADDLLDLTVGDGPENLVVIQPEQIVYKLRWLYVMEMVFLDTNVNKFFRMTWSSGATEYQDDLEPDINLTEVAPFIVRSTVFKKV